MDDAQESLRQRILQKYNKIPVYDEISPSYRASQFQERMDSDIFSRRYKYYIYGDANSALEQYEHMYQTLSNQSSRNQFNRYVYAVRLFLEHYFVSQKQVNNKPIDHQEVTQFLENRFHRIQERRKTTHCEDYKGPSGYSACFSLRAIRADSILNLLLLEKSLNSEGMLHSFIVDYYLIKKRSSNYPSPLDIQTEDMANYFQLTLATNTLTNNRLRFFEDFHRHNKKQESIFHCYFLAYISSIREKNFDLPKGASAPNVNFEEKVACTPYGA